MKFTREALLAIIKMALTMRTMVSIFTDDEIAENIVKLVFKK